MKKYIRVCNCCCNTFQTDKMTIECKCCSDKLTPDSGSFDYRFYKKYMDRIGWKTRELLIYPTGYIKILEENDGQVLKLNLDKLDKEEFVKLVKEEYERFCQDYSYLIFGH